MTQPRNIKNVENNCKIPQIVNTMPGFINKNKTKKTAIQTKFVRAENPIQNVAVGFTEVDMLAQVPSQTNL
jgi:hypothetical protein